MARQHWPVGTATVVADVAASLLADLDALTERSVAETTRLEAGYRQGAVPADDLWRAARANMELVLRRLAFESGSPDLDAVPAETGRRRAEQGLPLDALLHAFRIDFRIVWEAMIDVARRSHPDRLEAFLDGATWVWTVIDDISGAVVDAYRGAAVELAARDDAVRRRLLDAVLDGRDPAVSAIDAARSLDLPLDGPFVVVVTASVGPDAALRAVGARSAWSRRDDEQAGIVAVPAAGVASVVVALRALEPGSTGVSPPFGRLSDAPGALRLARLAARVSGGSVAVVDDVLLGVLAAAAPDAASAVVHAVLGGLLARPANQRRRLVATARAFLDGDGTVGAAAHRLGVHRNTVVNRLAAFEQLTGRSLQRPRQAAEVVVALEALAAHRTS